MLIHLGVLVRNCITTKTGWYMEFCVNEDSFNDTPIYYRELNEKYFTEREGYRLPIAVYLLRMII